MGRSHSSMQFAWPRRLRWLVVLVLGATVAGPWVPADQCHAQNPVAAESGRVVQPAGAVDPANRAAAEPPESLLKFYFRALGLFYSIAFLGLSFTLVALVALNLLAARRDNIVPSSLVESFEAHVVEKEFQQAYDLARQDKSFLGKMLSAGLGRLSQGYAQATEAMQEVGEEENMKLEHRLSYIALVGTISPMVGLLGTVDGMVASFRVIANTTTVPQPSELAAGISTALVTTLVGLWLAIPAILCYGILKNRLSRLVLEVGMLGEGLMCRVLATGKRR